MIIVHVIRATLSFTIIAVEVRAQNSDHGTVRVFLAWLWWVGVWGRWATEKSSSVFGYCVLENRVTSNFSVPRSVFSSIRRRRPVKKCISRERLPGLGRCTINKRGNSIDYCRPSLSSKHEICSGTVVLLGRTTSFANVSGRPFAHSKLKKRTSPVAKSTACPLFLSSSISKTKQKKQKHDDGISP